MYIQEISIEIKTKHDKDELIDELGFLLACYRRNGQTQGKIESQYIDKNKMFCLPFTLEKNSLSKKFNNSYVNNQIKKLEELCGSNLEFRTVGKTYETYKTPCKCRNSDFYILITNFLTIESPLTCGKCFKSVPLYRLPKYESEEYMSILGWESNYISCDTLQMNCKVGERWALNQMENVNSQLSKQGFEICRKIEELTNIPTYYYLHNYRKFRGDDLSRPCPICNKGWDLKEKLHFFDFKCDNCKIVSTVSPNT
ncbi:MAG: DUF2310 family Zn-ribbon-containing protein [Acidobacteriota bacterium]